MLGGKPLTQGQQCVLGRGTLLYLCRDLAVRVPLTQTGGHSGLMDVATTTERVHNVPTGSLQNPSRATLGGAPEAPARDRLLPRVVRTDRLGGVP